MKLITIFLAFLTFGSNLVRADSAKEHIYAVRWGQNVSLAPLSITYEDSLLFMWHGINSVGFVNGDEVDDEHIGQFCPNNTHFLGNRSPVLIKMSDLNVSAMTYTFVSQNPTKCPHERIKIFIQPKETIQGGLLYGMVIFLLLVSQIIAYTISSYGITVFSASGVTMVIGAMVSLIVSLVADKPIVDFSPDAFFYVLLPCIVFESGYTFHKRHFFDNIGSILTFALLGAFVSSVITGSLMYFITAWVGNSRWTLLQSLIFGTLISSTDPVATLAIFSSLPVHPTLYGLVFGESVMNDAVSLVLYSVLTAFDENSFDLSVTPTVMWHFALIFVASTLIGVMTAMGLSFTLKMIQSTTPTAQIIVLLLVAYLCYIFCQALDFSGIVAIFFYGCTARHYAWHNLSDISREGSVLLFKVLAEFMESFVFLYVGLSVFPLGSARYQVGVIFAAIIACYVGRAFNIFPLSFLANLLRTEKITLEMQMLMCHAGLRGAVSYGLAVNYDYTGKLGIRSTTQAVVIFTVLVLGGSTGSILKKLNLLYGVPDSGVQAGSEGSVNVMYSPVRQYSIEDENEDDRNFDRRARCTEVVRRVTAVSQNELVEHSGMAELGIEEGQGCRLAPARVGSGTKMLEWIRSADQRYVLPLLTNMQPWESVSRDEQTEKKDHTSYDDTLLINDTFDEGRIDGLSDEEYRSCNT